MNELRREVRAFLADGGFVPAVNAWMDGYDREFTRRVGARGWIGMTWPRQYGGGGRSALERHVVTEELLAAGAPVAAHWFADRQVGPQLLRFGTEEQRSRFLPPITRGECCFAVGMSEPDAGSDLASVRTRAARVQGGWSVTGTKVWTSHADRSDYMVTLCRTASSERRHEGLSQLIVDLSQVDVRPIVGLDGNAHFCEVILDGTFVPDAMVVGEVGQGWAQVTAELAFERSGPERFLSAMPLLTAAVDQAADADAERLGRAYAALVALRRLSLDVVAALEAGVAPQVDAALVKDLGTRFEQDLVEQLRLTARDDAFRAFAASAQLAAPGFTLRGGTTEILRSIIGRAVVR